MSKKLPLVLALLLGGLVNLFAGEGIVLYMKPSPNAQYTAVYIDTNNDGVEDTIIALGGSTLHQSIERRLKEGSIVQFDDKQVEKGTDGFNYMWGGALTSIDGKPARPNQR
jgi:hypothetical protein